MLIPIRTDSPLRRTPYMNWGIIALNVVVFLFTISHPLASDAYALGVRQPKLYQFFTYQFLHAGWMHIIGNMLFLYLFGNNINDRLGNLGYMFFYLAGGVFSGASFVMTASVDTSLVGASGAISAVTGAYLVLLPRSNVTIFYFWFLIGVTEIASLWFILGFFAYDIFLAASANSDPVAHMAHIGGSIFGIVICGGLLLLKLLPRDPFDVIAMIQRWNRRRQYRDMVAGGYNPFDYSRPGPPGRHAPPPPPDARTARILDIRAAISESLAAHDLDKATRLYGELKTLDPQHVLARQQQLDVANHLAAQQSHAQAAEAYEVFLKQYPKYEQIQQVELMLGLIYSRYLNQPDRARACLQLAMGKFHTGREMEMAREELIHLGAAPTPPTKY